MNIKTRVFGPIRYLYSSLWTRKTPYQIKPEWIILTSLQQLTSPSLFWIHFKVLPVSLRIEHFINEGWIREKKMKVQTNSMMNYI